jgi:hypothetical protein
MYKRALLIFFLVLGLTLSFSFISAERECGGLFELIDSGTEVCCEGLTAKKTAFEYNSSFERCRSESGICNAKCWDEEELNKSDRSEFIIYSIYLLLVIAYIIWMLSVMHRLLLGFWKAYYPNKPFVIKSFLVGLIIRAAVRGVPKKYAALKNKVKDADKLLRQFRIGMLLFIVIFILSLAMSG